MRGIRVLALCIVAPLPATAQPAEPDAPLLAHPVVAVSGGMEGFITTSLRDIIGDGAVWNVRVSAGARADVRIELAYTGSAQSLAATEGSMLVGHGVKATLRVNVAPWVSPIEPFIFMGAGWTHYGVRSPRMRATLSDTDDVLELPFGLGAARRFGRFIADVRIGVQISSGADLQPITGSASSSRDSAIMHRFGASAGVGFEI